MRRSLPSERLAALSAEASAKADAGRPAFDPAEASIRERLALVAGALQCVAAMLPSGESHVVQFNGRWAHLGSHSVRRILDLADHALDIGRLRPGEAFGEAGCAGCEPSPFALRAPADKAPIPAAAEPAPIGAGGDGGTGSQDKPDRCPECGTTTGRHSPDCGASWSPDYAPPAKPADPPPPGTPGKADPDKAFDAIEREISRLIGEDSVLRSPEGEAG